VLTAWLENKTQSKKGFISLLSHKNIHPKSLAWQQVDAWLAPIIATPQTTVWILPDSVPAHAWLERLRRIETSPWFETALLGGDFPPAQDRFWKEQLHQRKIHTLVLTVELAEKWLKNTNTTRWISFFNTLTWVDCLPSQSVLETLSNAPHEPTIQLLNPPIALPPALLEEITPADITGLPPATGLVHRFTYAVSSEDKLLNQLKQWVKPQPSALKSPPFVKLLARLKRWEQILGMRNAEPQVYTLVHEDSSTANDNEDAPDIEPCKKFIVVCQNEPSLLACQKLLGEAGIEAMLSLSASMPWGLFKPQLEDWFTHGSTLLLLEESTLPAWLHLLPAIFTPKPLHWVWLAPPKNPNGIAHACQTLPFYLQVDCHFIKTVTPFKHCSLAWQWLLLQKKPTFNPRKQQPEPLPISRWGWVARLNRLLYLLGL
jgi:hypothetical protein